VLHSYQEERRRLISDIESSDESKRPALEGRLLGLFNARIDRYLDQGSGACHFRRPEIADVVEGALKHFEGERYEMLAWCVMPNHVHTVFKESGGWPLARILHSWKSYTANEANKILGRTGALWQDEYFDHLVRNAADLDRCVRYVLANPASARLKNWPYVWSAYDSEEAHELP
jgi:REP element-mobilizing transposase RayT